MVSSPMPEVLQNTFGVTRKSISMASKNSSHAFSFASATAFWLSEISQLNQESPLWAESNSITPTRPPTVFFLFFTFSTHGTFILYFKPSIEAIKLALCETSPQIYSVRVAQIRALSSWWLLCENVSPNYTGHFTVVSMHGRKYTLITSYSIKTFNKTSTVVLFTIYLCS